MMMVIWRVPARPTPIQRLVSRITEVGRHEVNAVVELAFHARLEADIADEDGRHYGHVTADAVLCLDTTDMTP